MIGRRCAGMWAMGPHQTARRAIVPDTLTSALAAVEAPPLALLGLGIPGCPATQLLPASLSGVANARPELPIALGILASPADWAAREAVLWPRGIRISRSVVPILVILRDGSAIATRRGGASAYAIDTWLAARAGLAPTRLADEWLADEQDELARLAARRAQHAAVTGRGATD
jgi:hypothetical protein